ncbi:hypothetical protein [Prevotella corporis]|uniref:hypothetical protein n=1 Tax=Prevotella corporis TaxID=28128 RepID=UPI0027E56080|nr:hypothetical protein [Prevotella corporis]
MMRKILLFVSSVVIFCSCNVGKVVPVDYELAHNYFVINPRLPSTLKITSQSEFDHYFGLAAVMGKNGEPTPIDFTRQFVITKVLPESNRAVGLTPVNLNRSDGQLVLSYRVERGKQRQWVSQPFFIIIVDKKYQKYNVTEKME